MGNMMFRKHVALGVELSAGRIRLAECTGGQRWQGLELELAWQEAGDEGQSLLRNALRQSALSARQAVLALPASAVMCHSLRLPAGLGEAERVAQLAARVEQLFPAMNQALCIDFVRLGRDSQAGEQVLLLACRQEQVMAGVRWLAGAGIRTLAVDMDLYALIRLCNTVGLGWERSLWPAPPHLALAVLDGQGVTLGLVEQGRLVHVARNRTGDGLAVNDAQGLYGIPLPGEAGRHAVQDGRSTVEFLASALARLLRESEGVASAVRPEQLVLAGDGSDLEGLDLAIERQCALKVCRFSPMDERLCVRPAARGCWAVACGLALGGRSRWIR